MNESLAERFMSALHELERTREVEEMAQMFAEGATLRRIPQERRFQGEEGARAFWRQYLDQFSHVETEFLQVIEAGERVALEWRSRARRHDGQEIVYEGVSCLEGSDRVQHFRTYYDPTAVLSEKRLDEAARPSPT